MVRTITRFAIIALAVLFAIPVLANTVSASHDHDDHHHRGYTSYNYGPIFPAGGYYYPYSYGWNGWSYNRVHYRYHSSYYRPYGYAGYGGLYGGYGGYGGYGRYGGYGGYGRGLYGGYGGYGGWGGYGGYVPYYVGIPVGYVGGYY